MSNLTHSLRIPQVKPLSIDIYLINVMEFSCISILSQYFHYLYLSQKMTLPNWNFHGWLVDITWQTTMLFLSDMNGINSIFFYFKMLPQCFVDEKPVFYMNFSKFNLRALCFNLLKFKLKKNTFIKIACACVYVYI